MTVNQIIALAMACSKYWTH